MIPLISFLSTPSLSHTADCKDLFLLGAGAALGIVGARYFTVPSSLPLVTSVAPVHKKQEETLINQQDACNTFSWAMAHVTESLLSLFTAEKKPSDNEVATVVCKGLENALKTTVQESPPEDCSSTPTPPHYNKTLLSTVQNSLQQEGIFEQLMAAARKELQLHDDLATASIDGEKEQDGDHGFEVLDETEK